MHTQNERQKIAHTKATRWTNIPKMNAIRLNYQCRDTLMFRIKVKTGNLIWQHLYFSYRIENVYAFAHIFFLVMLLFKSVSRQKWRIVTIWYCICGFLLPVWKSLHQQYFFCASYHLVVECVKPHLQFEMHASTGVIPWHV